MNGNSLNYNDWQSNYALLNIDGNNLKSLNHICFYSENFKRTDNLSEEELKEKLESENAEIFVKDISIQFVQEIDKDGYTVNISALDGQYFQDKAELRL
jgi:ferredoxin-fold anticodon binding domain-containing protein